MGGSMLVAIIIEIIKVVNWSLKTCTRGDAGTDFMYHARYFWAPRDRF